MAKYVYIPDADVYINPDQVISIGDYDTLTEIIMVNGMRYRTTAGKLSVRNELEG